MIFRYLPVCFAGLFCGFVFADAAIAQIDFNFPKNDVPVVRVDERYSEANKDKRPMLLVYPDGRVIRPVSDKAEDDYTFTLSEKRFNEFLDTVLVKSSFATIPEETIENTLSPRRPARDSFKVSTNTADSSHVVNFGNSWLYNRLGTGRTRLKYAKAEHLQRFLKVEDACREIANLALVGGEEAFQDTVKKASMEFKKAYPDGPAISDADLFSVRRGSDGKVAVRFRVDKKIVESDPVSVWVKKAKGDLEPSIEVKIDKSLLLNDAKPAPPKQVK